MLTPETQHPVRCIGDICPAADAFLICSVRQVFGSSWPVLSFHLPAGGRLLQSHQIHFIINRSQESTPVHRDVSIITCVVKFQRILTV